MLATRYKQAIDRAVHPMALRLARSGISPSAITLAIPMLGLLVCWWFVRTRAVVPFCVLIVLVGSLDGLDGAVARAGGRVTKFGAYLDAMCDRYFESSVVLAVALVTGYWFWSIVVLAGSLMVSYAKARTAIEVSVSNTEWPDLMERTERGVLYLAGLAAADRLSWKPIGRDLFWWTLVVVAILTHLTVIQRVLRARRFILERDNIATPQSHR